MERRATKRRVDFLFLVFSSCSAILGLIAVIVPHLFEWVLIHHGETLSFRANNSDPTQKVEHLTVRLYGSLLLGFAFLIFQVRQSSDALTRRSVVQASWGVCLLSSLSLIRAQLTSGGNLSQWNWISILFFTALSSFFGYFAWIEKISVFESLSRDF
jgi:hypothetical protein